MWGPFVGLTIEAPHSFVPHHSASISLGHLIDFCQSSHWGEAFSVSFSSSDWFDCQSLDWFDCQILVDLIVSLSDWFFDCQTTEYYLILMFSIDLIVSLSIDLIVSFSIYLIVKYWIDLIVSLSDWFFNCQTPEYYLILMFSIDLIVSLSIDLIDNHSI